MGWFKKLGFATMRFERATNPAVRYYQDYATEHFFGGNQVKAAHAGHSLGVTALDIVGSLFGYPGIGSALNGTDQLQDGNTKGAVISFASAAVQAGASSNTSGWEKLGGSTAPATTTAGSAATSGTTSAVGDSTTFVAFDAPTDYAAAFGPKQTVVGSGIYGYTGEIGSTVTGIPGGTYTVGTGGAIGIDFGTAMANNIPNLTLRDVKNGAGFVKTAAGLYDLMNRDGSVRATYGTGAQQVPQEQINYLFSAPTMVGAIPTNRAADINGAALAAQAQASAAQQRAVVLAMACGVVLYLSGAFRK